MVITKFNLDKNCKALKERKSQAKSTMSSSPSSLQHRGERVQRPLPLQFQRLRVVMTKLKLDKDRTSARVGPSLQFLQARAHF